MPDRAHVPPLLSGRCVTCATYLHLHCSHLQLLRDPSRAAFDIALDPLHTPLNPELTVLGCVAASHLLMPESADENVEVVRQEGVCSALHIHHVICSHIMHDAVGAAPSLAAGKT